MNPNNIQQSQQPKKEGVELKYATLSIVRELDNDIQDAELRT